MGVDRWVAMIGAHHEFRSALCVVDAGTATTLDALDKTGLHLGGQIIPGVHMMGEALHANASDIGTAGRGRKGPTDTLGLFGKSTSEAVAFGALAAAAGAVELAVKRMRSAGFRPKLVLTGGDASRILEQLHSSALHRPNLVLQGLSVMSNGES
jgi:type III pantothenate kinase